MTWYGAHIVTYVRFTAGLQDKYPIWENIVLIGAATAAAAHEEAERIGRTDYQGTDVVWEGQPGVWTFAGVRKLIECQYMASQITPLDSTGVQQASGLEITYLQLEITNEADFLNFLQGRAVQLLYEE